MLRFAGHIVLTCVVVLSLLMFAVPALAADTYVSLTFDDGRASQVNAGYLLNQYGLQGTFFVNSGNLGSSDYYMSLSELQGVAAQNHEIGGHGNTHLDLTTVSESVAVDEVCGDQEQITAWGFTPRSFAYPYGHSNAAVQDIVGSCSARGYSIPDYTSARGVGGLQCPTCFSAETLPPANPYHLKTPPSGYIATLDDLKNSVVAAEAMGGWLVLPFHSVCDAPGTAPHPGNAGDCSDVYAISYNDLEQFLQWLGTRPGVEVKTVGDVMDMPMLPPPPPVGPNLVLNPSLEYDLDFNNRPDGYLLSGYGTNTYVYSRLNGDAHTGAYSEKLSITSYTSGDRKIATAQDLSAHTIPVIPGVPYETGVWYKSDAPMLLVAFYHDATGWHYWNESPYLPAADSWTEARWRTPVPPPGADYWSFGPTLTQAGNITVDDFSAVPVITGDCDNQKPSLTLTRVSVYWASYEEYLAATLTADFNINNIGPGYAYNLQVNDVRSTMGVICTTVLPAFYGHITGNSVQPLTLKYLIPPGVENFRTTLDVTIDDGCGTNYRLSG